MANAGVVSIVVSPAARWRNLLLCALRSLSNVVQDWPEAGTNCRSSMQTGHVPGGASDGGYCVPQAEQMNAGMISPFGRWTTVVVPIIAPWNKLPQLMALHGRSAGRRARSLLCRR
jgi:hypothetical protein